MMRLTRRLYRWLRTCTRRTLTRATVGELEALDPGIVTALEGFKG